MGMQYYNTTKVWNPNQSWSFRTTFYPVVMLSGGIDVASSAQKAHFFVGSLDDENVSYPGVEEPVNWQP